MAPTVLSVLAHPDDAEFLCAGTLIRLVREKGWNAHIATMTPGDCGSQDQGPEAISRIRREEAAKAAELIQAECHCLEERDLQIFYHLPALEKVTRLLREVQPDLVLTHSPDDYMLDHEMTSMLVRAAAFDAPIPNFLHDRGHPPPLKAIPHLYYCDPIEGKDKLGNEVEATTLIDITEAIAQKEAMLACHASQREWLLKHHGMDQYILSMKQWGEHRGQQTGSKYAEGYRQHKGHSYPQSNLLRDLLS